MALCEGGADLIQLRSKNSAPRDIERMGEEILPVCRRFNAGLVVNDHPEIARKIGADYCHLGQEDFFDVGYRHVTDLQPQGAPSIAIGLSTHSPEQADRATSAGACYLAVGPVYATGTKPTAKPVTLDYVRWAAEHVSLPWFAIGGVTLETLDDVLDAGARRICVVSGILNAPDITAACRAFKKRLV